jgi:hypothetical protein
VGVAIIEFIFKARDMATPVFRTTKAGLTDLLNPINVLGKTAVGAAEKYTGLGKRLLGVGGAALGAAWWAVQASNEFEVALAKLTTVYKDEEKAAKVLDWAKRKAVETPFNVQEVVDATSRLEIYGLTAYKWFPLVGDLAAAMGQDVVSATEAVADAVLGGRMTRLQESFGINENMLIQYGAHQGRTLGTLANQTVEDRIAIEHALQRLITERFGGGMTRFMETIPGKISNAQDALFRLRDAIGRAIRPEVVRLIDRVTRALDRLTQAAETPRGQALLRLLFRAAVGAALLGAALVALPHLLSALFSILSGLSIAVTTLWALPKILALLPRLIPVLRAAGGAAAVIGRALRVAFAFLYRAVGADLLSAIATVLLRLAAIVTLVWVVVKTIQFFRDYWGDIVDLIHDAISAARELWDILSHPLRWLRDISVLTHFFTTLSDLSQKVMTLASRTPTARLLSPLAWVLRKLGGDQELKGDREKTESKKVLTEAEQEAADAALFATDNVDTLSTAVGHLGEAAAQTSRALSPLFEVLDRPVTPPQTFFNAERLARLRELYDKQYFEASGRAREQFTQEMKERNPWWFPLVGMPKQIPTSPWGFDEEERMRLVLKERGPLRRFWDWVRDIDTWTTERTGPEASRANRPYTGPGRPDWARYRELTDEELQGMAEYGRPDPRMAIQRGEVIHRLGTDGGTISLLGASPALRQAMAEAVRLAAARVIKDRA